MGLSTYLLATICLVVASQRCHAQSTWRTIDAVYNEPMGSINMLHIFSGDQAMMLQNRQERMIKSRIEMDYFLPADFAIQASVQTVNNKSVSMHYGNQFGYFFTMEMNRDTAQWSIASKKFKYGPKRAFLQNGGPDAAARKSGKIYLFKGCMMAERKKWYSWGQPENVSVTRNWPCDVDAAWWETDDSMTVLKGSQFWRWNADGTNTGPFSMFDHYSRIAWNP